MLKNNLRTHSPQKNENAVLTTAGYFEVSTPVRLQRQWKRVFTVNKFGPKFQPKLTILIFWPKFAQKGCFQFKQEKVNTTIEFRKFELD